MTRNALSTPGTSPRPRGFAAMVSITLVGLVSVSILTVSALLRAEARRADLSRVDAQLRELVHVGGELAVKQSTTWPASSPAATQDISLPAGLVTDGYTLQLKIDSPTNDRLQLEVAAKVENRVSTQTLVFQNSTGGWKLDRAMID